MTVTRRLGPPGLITADLDRFRRFYEDIFGFRLISLDHPARAAFRRLATFAEANEATLAFLVFEIPTFRSDHADDLFSRRGRIDHLTFAAGDDADFAVLAARLVDAGASSGCIDELGPNRSVLFVDPDGAHHQLQVADRSWQPASTTEVVDEELLRKVRELESPTINHNRRQQ